MNNSDKADILTFFSVFLCWDGFTNSPHEFFKGVNRYFIAPVITLVDLKDKKAKCLAASNWQVELNLCSDALKVRKPEQCEFLTPFHV